MWMFLYHPLARKHKLKAHQKTIACKNFHNNILLSSLKKEHKVLIKNRSIILHSLQWDNLQQQLRNSGKRWVNFTDLVLYLKSWHKLFKIFCIYQLKAQKVRTTQAKDFIGVYLWTSNKDKKM